MTKYITVDTDNEVEHPYNTAYEARHKLIELVTYGQRAYIITVEETAEINFNT